LRYVTDYKNVRNLNEILSTNNNLVIDIASKFVGFRKLWNQINVGPNRESNEYLTFRARVSDVDAQYIATH